MAWLEIALAVAAFAVLCIVVLSTAPRLVEPDDYAYRASVVAMTEGHFLTLSTAQVDALAVKAGGPLGLSIGPRVGPVSGGVRAVRLMPIPQWVQLADRRWISEKDPGYPFLAVAFQALGIIRWAPLFYCALACLGLYIGGRRWLGRFGGTAAVGLYCSSGTAIVFAWRAYMPTFLDASLIAAGTGVLLWAVLAVEASTRRRSVVVFCAGAGVFDTLVYGGPLRYGYRPGEIQFSLSAIAPNLEYMPRDLIWTTPMYVLGLAAFAWIVGQWVRRRRSAGEQATAARRDLAVGLALGASWLAIWGLYFAYTWTVGPGADATWFMLPLVRFYVPALGLISLLGAWLVTRVPGRGALAAVAVAAVTAVMFGLGIHSFDVMTTRAQAVFFQVKGGPCPVRLQNAQHRPVLPVRGCRVRVGQGPIGRVKQPG